MLPKRFSRIRTCLPAQIVFFLLILMPQIGNAQCLRLNVERPGSSYLLKDSEYVIGLYLINSGFLCQPVEAPYARLTVHGGVVQNVASGSFADFAVMEGQQEVLLSYDGELLEGEGLVGFVLIRTDSAADNLSLLFRHGAVENYGSEHQFSYELVNISITDDHMWESLAMFAETSADSADRYHRLILEFLMNQTPTANGEDLLSDYAAVVNAGISAVETLDSVYQALQIPVSASLFDLFGTTLLSLTGVINVV